MAVKYGLARYEGGGKRGRPQRKFVDVVKLDMRSRMIGIR